MNNNLNKISVVFLLSFACLSFMSCSQGVQGIGTSLLTSTGLMTQSQADAAFNAGGKLVKAASGLTEEQEYYLGRGVSAMVLSKYAPYKNAAVTRYVNRVGMALAAVSDRPETYRGYHFLVLDTSEVNAVSAPGGFVFVTKGFLKLIPDEDALASVLAHEVGHVVKGHGVSAISKSNLTQALMIIGKEAAASSTNANIAALTETFGNSITDVMNTVLEKGYSRSQEYDADKYAALLLQRSGYNQGGLITMLKQLQKFAESKPAGGWFSTHPSPKNRIDEAEDVVKVTADNTHPQEVRTSRFKREMQSLG